MLKEFEVGNMSLKLNESLTVQDKNFGEVRINYTIKSLNNYTKYVYYNYEGHKINDIVQIYNVNYNDVLEEVKDLETYFKTSLLLIYKQIGLFKKESITDEILKKELDELDYSMVKFFEKKLESNYVKLHKEFVQNKPSERGNYQQSQS